MHTADLANEWTLLQNQFDSYEKYSLLIKLMSIAILSMAIFLSASNLHIAMILMILWLQDAIWKTFQARIEVRLLAIEAYIAKPPAPEETPNLACQFNSQFLNNRPGGIAMLKEYVQQAIRPTVAYPHVILLLVMLSIWLTNN